MRTAAIVTVGSELVEGLRIDTNTSEIARALNAVGLTVLEATSVGDQVDLLTEVLKRTTALCDLVIVTGGLGPTHDDVTREAASKALGVPLTRDPRIEELLTPIAQRHARPEAAEQVLTQADVLDGATVIDATTGTAPGLVVSTQRGALALLPGPPAEMRPMLAKVLEGIRQSRPAPAQMGVVGLTESDAQVRAQRALVNHPGVRLTVLARPGDVKVILVAESTDAEGLRAAADAVADALGEHVYARDDSSLAAAVIRDARKAGVRIACAESCTGGLLAAALTSVPGASEVFAGCAVTYENRAKVTLTHVPDELLQRFGAVSREVARAMAVGSREVFDVDLSVSITGIAGPTGGSAEKPVGLVWFGVADGDHSFAYERRFPAMGREGIRERSVSWALDLLRNRIRLR